MDANQQPIRISSVDRVRINLLSRQSRTRACLSQVVHSSQLLKLDGTPIASLGKHDLSAGSPFYQQLTIGCDKILEGKTLDWSVQSYSFFFSRINKSPYFSKNEGRVNFLNVTMNNFAFGILLVLSIFTLIIYKNRVSDRLTYSVSIGSFFMSIYFANASNLLFGFPMTMLVSHKIADISIWTGIFLFYYAYDVEGYSSTFVSRLTLLSCLNRLYLRTFYFGRPRNRLCLPRARRVQNRT